MVDEKIIGVASCLMDSDTLWDALIPLAEQTVAVHSLAFELAPGAECSLTHSVGM